MKKMVRTRKLFYLPLEVEPMRYSESLDNEILKQVGESEFELVRLPHFPEFIRRADKRKLASSDFLDAPYTTRWKASQLAQLASFFELGRITSEDVIFLSDLWFPGIEAVAYMKHFCEVNPKLVGILHAGSFTDTDHVRKMERWASMFENALFDIFDSVLVASQFIKDDVASKRLIDRAKIKVVRFPEDPRISYEQSEPRENIVVFNGRLTGEKQPEMFEWLQKVCHVPSGTRWVSTHAEQFSKDAYFDLLRRAKVVVSFALQENFGFGISEAMLCGCTPVVPDRLVYPELYMDCFRYRNLIECKNMVESFLWTYPVIPVLSQMNAFDLKQSNKPNILHGL